MRRILVLGGQASHGDEPGEDDRLDRGLGPAGEHGVRVSALDQLGRLADRVRAGRAGRDGRVVRPPDSQRDRQLTARRIDQHTRDEARRDPFVAALTEDLALLHDPRDPADRRAEGDSDAVRIEPVQPRALDRLRTGGERHQDVAVELALLLRRGDAGRIEILDLGGNPNRVIARVEGADPVDPALTGKRGAPGFGRRVPERGDRSETGDDDSAHDCALDLPQSRCGCAKGLSPEGDCPRKRSEPSSPFGDRPLRGQSLEVVQKGTVPGRGLSPKTLRTQLAFWGQTPAGSVPGGCAERDCPRTGTVPENAPNPARLLGTDPCGVSPWRLCRKGLSPDGDCPRKRSEPSSPFGDRPLRGQSLEVVQKGTVPGRGLSPKTLRTQLAFWGQTPAGSVPGGCAERDCPRTGTVPENAPNPARLLGTDPCGVSPWRLCRKGLSPDGDCPRRRSEPSSPFSKR